MVLVYFPAVDKIPWQKQFKEASIFGSRSDGGTAHHGQEVKSARAWGCWLHFIHSLEEEDDKCSRA